MRITGFLKKVIRDLEKEGGEAKKDLLVATVSLELGVSEKDIEEVLETFQKANILKIVGDDIVLY
jgi:hypothetical protein